MTFRPHTREGARRKSKLGTAPPAQKLEAVGQLAGGIAHDFNNMLTAIIGYATLLSFKVENDSTLKSFATQILSIAEKSADLTRQLLTFSRKQVISPKQIDLNELIKGTEKLLHRVIGEDIELKTHLVDKNVTVMVDPGQIEQVLMNLCTNARDAMPKGLLSINRNQILGCELCKNVTIWRNLVCMSS
jgi:C4-dicarboxylate-specific signal transduction histidine kinase